MKSKSGEKIDRDQDQDTGDLISNPQSGSVPSSREATLQALHDDGDYPYAQPMLRREYEEKKALLQTELMKVQKWVKDDGQRVVALFEGRDAAGKGGTIKRFMEHLNPRLAQVVALEKPNKYERGQWYFQRYIERLPTRGEMAFFDRSWYNRAGVERVMGFCTSSEYEEFLQHVPLLEKVFVQTGITFFKYWFSVSRIEQARRFHARQNSPLKQWKLSAIDRVSLQKWDEYTVAKSAMFQHTDTDHAPWTVVKSDDKKRARINCLRHFLHSLDYPGKDNNIVQKPDPKILLSASEYYEDVSSLIMSLPVIALILLAAGFYVGWNIGANDAANCIGTMVGAQVLSFRRAALLMGAFVILGGVLQGHHVMKTVGKGIVITSSESYQEIRSEEAPKELKLHFPDERLPDLAVFVALLSAGLFVTLATFTRIPVSTSQAIVGGVAGVGLGIVGLDGSFFKLVVLQKILGCWVLSPVLCMVLAFCVYLVLGRLSRRVNMLLWSRILSVLVIAAACYVSYSLGANDVGNAIGPLLNKFPAHGVWLSLLGGVAMAVGALTFGRRVTETVGKNITPLDLSGAFAAQVSAAFGVHFFSMLGIPVSTSQAVVGAIIGVGLTKGLKVVSGGKIAGIVGGWILAPTGAALFSCFTYRAIIWIMGATNP